MTAERVRRFADDVERNPRDDESRRLWRAALDDFRRSVRDARAEGSDVAAIQEAAGERAPGRFARPDGEADDTQPDTSSPAAA